MSPSPAPIVVLVPGSELDIATIGGAMAQVRSTIAGADPKHVVLDLASVQFMDSSGIAGIIALRNEVVSGGGALFLAGLTPRVERTITVMGLAPLLLGQPADWENGDPA